MTLEQFDTLEREDREKLFIYWCLQQDPTQKVNYNKKSPLISFMKTFTKKRVLWNGEKDVEIGGKYIAILKHSETYCESIENILHFAKTFGEVIDLYQEQLFNERKMIQRHENFPKQIQQYKLEAK